jgi:spore germination protein YaaH
MTIRHDEKNDRAINLYNIGNNFVFPGKNITIAKVFKILEIEPISTFTSIQNEVGTTTDEEEDDDDQE